MRLLLDESVPAKLRRALPSHAVRTAVEMGWSGVKNGKLLALAAAEFGAFISVDKNLPFQQNLKALRVLPFSNPAAVQKMAAWSMVGARRT